MKTVVSAAILAASSAISAAAGSLPYDYTSYYAFGDSLSDDGKLGALVLSPGVDGAFTNGLAWTELLAAEFAAAGRPAANLALGGAVAAGPDLTTEDATLSPSDPRRLATFAGQVGFLDDLIPGPGVSSFFSGDNPLVSVWFGANDLFAYIESMGLAPVTPTLAADAVAAGIQAVNALGTQFDEFVVLNMPDLGRTPAYSYLKGDPFGTGTDATFATSATVEFNARLDDNLDALRLAGLTIHVVDIFSLFQKIIAGNLGDDLQDLAGVDPFKPCTVSMTEPLLNGLGVCDDADLYLFADAVHPNRIAHEIIAEKVTAAVVPVPAGLPMLAGALVLAGVVARRRSL